MREFNAIIVGVGGQGVMTAGQILASTFIKTYPNFNVFMTEVFGEAQRTGPISSQVRLTTEESPLITPGTANLILALEPLEGFRYLHHLAPQGTLVLNLKPVFPIESLSRVCSYPDLKKALQKLKQSIRLIFFHNERAWCNIEALGLAFREGLLPVGKNQLKKAIKEVQPRLSQTNLKIFEEIIKKNCSR